MDTIATDRNILHIRGDVVMKNTKILIIGGGIAGLATMNRLESIGYEPKLVESTANIRTDGTGILLGINAVSILSKMGFAKILAQKGVKLTDMIGLDDTGRQILSGDLGYMEEKSGFGTYAVQRDGLCDILLSGVNRQNITVNKKVSKVENRQNGVFVFFEDGDSELYDLVVGADGIHSNVRKSVFGEIGLRDAKQGCWRFVVQRPDRFNKNAITEYFGLGKRVGYMPIGDDKIYIYMLLDADKYDKNNPFSTPELLKRFDFGGEWQNLSPAVTDESKSVFNEIKDLSKICLVKDRVVLVGDAAHALTPNMGQGAAMGIEDADVLCDALSMESNIERALSVFKQRRYKRVKEIRNKSYIIGKMAQSPSKILSKIRNTAYTLLPPRMLTKDLLKTLGKW